MCGVFDRKTIAYFKWSEYNFDIIFIAIFIFTPSCNLWVTSQDFAKRKTLLRYIFAVNFIGIAYVVVKFKFFKVFVLLQNPWKGSFFGGVGWGGALGPYSTEYCSILLNLWPELVSNKTKAVWKIIQNFAYFGSIGTHPQFWPTLRPNLLLENQKYCQKLKFLPKVLT